MNIEVVAQQALSFNANSRAYLAEILLESLDYGEDVIISKQWQQEINKRCEEIKDNPDCLIDGALFMSELKKQYL